MKEQYITASELGDWDDGDAQRRRRGLVMAATTKVTQDKNGNYRVRSQSGDNVYTVSKDCDTCTCPDFALTKKPCKHISTGYLIFPSNRKRNPKGTTKSRTKN